jgi:5-hydroxyisourate hydrolase-like protein (transthyretin family)
MFMKTFATFGLLLLFGLLPTAAQTIGQGASGINGRVTLDGKPAAGVQVTLFLHLEVFSDKPPKSHTFTDQEGRYAFANLPPGRYDVIPRAPAAVLANPSTDAYYLPIPARRVTLNEKEDRTGVDLELISGGVLSGRVTDNAGRPLAGANVNLFRLGEQNRRYLLSHYWPMNRADDRGVYRLFGLPAGRYVVCLNSSENRQGVIPATCALSAGEKDEPTIYDLTPGKEITTADIRALLRQKTYAARGRTFEAATGRPVVIGLSLADRELRSGQNGEFAITGLLPGHYQLKIGGPALDQDLTGEPISFNITDTDVENLEVPLRPGLALQGELVIENTSRAPSLPLSSFIIHALMKQPEGGSVGYTVSATPDAKGRFRVGGLQKKVAELFVYSQNGSNTRLRFLRVERDGVPVENKFDLTDGKSIAGLRLVYGIGTGVLRGKITVINGTLPENAQAYLYGRPAANKNIWVNTYANANLEFEAKDLLPGDYELELEVGGVRVINGKRVYWKKDFSASIANDNVTELNITLDLVKDYVELPN